MEVDFDIKRVGHTTIAKLWFKIYHKINHYVFTVHISDSDDWTCINSYYFNYKIEYGYRTKLKYKEHSNCFRNIANKLYTNNHLYFFDLDINKEFEFVDKKELKQYFLEINEIIMNKMKKYFKKYLKNKDIKESNDYISDLTDDEDYKF